MNEASVLSKIPDAESWTIVVERDASFDGRLFYGVLSTGVYCRPSCPSRRPRFENARFFDSADEAEAAGFRECRRCLPRSIAGIAAMVRRVTHFIDAHPTGRITLAELSAVANLSPSHLLRSFRKATGVTPKAYADERRMRRFGAELPRAANVTEAIYAAGFGASSRAYEKAQRELGMQPAEVRKRGAGVSIRYTITPTEFGQLLVASTGRGVCSVRLGDDPGKLESEFRRDFSRAQLTRNDEELANLVDQILVLIGSAAPHPEIPVDVRATAFQRRVWEYLRTIPRGETRSYSQIAATLGAPKSTRAVARACATNEVALIVPCHRVIGADGKLTGFRWGLDRKRQLLEKEKSGKR